MTPFALLTGLPLPAAGIALAVGRSAGSALAAAGGVLLAAAAVDIWSERI